MPSIVLRVRCRCRVERRASFRIDYFSETNRSQQPKRSKYHILRQEAHRKYEPCALEEASEAERCVRGLYTISVGKWWELRSMAEDRLITALNRRWTARLMARQ